MGIAKPLSFRNIRGTFFKGLEETMQAMWLPLISHNFSSDQPSETYDFLGQSPAMEEWIGQRKKTSPSLNTLTIINKDFSAGIEFKRKSIQYDKTGQVRTRIADLGARAAIHPQKLLTTLILGNGTAYDGTAFYADRSSLPTGGSIDNDVGASASTPAAPTSAEMVTAILAAITTMLAANDDQGEPLNEFAAGFAVMLPPNMAAAGAAALLNEFTAAGVSNTLKAQGKWSVQPIINPRLSAASTVFHTFRVDSDVKPLIWQEEEATSFDALAEGSDYATEFDKHAYFAKRSGEVAFGEPGMAVRTTFS